MSDRLSLMIAPNWIIAGLHWIPQSTISCQLIIIMIRGGLAWHWTRDPMTRPIIRVVANGIPPPSPIKFIFFVFLSPFCCKCFWRHSEWRRGTLVKCLSYWENDAQESIIFHSLSLLSESQGIIPQSPPLHQNCYCWDWKELPDLEFN